MMLNFSIQTCMISIRLRSLISISYPASSPIQSLSRSHGCFIFTCSTTRLELTEALRGGPFSCLWDDCDAGSICRVSAHGCPLGEDQHSAVVCRCSVEKIATSSLDSRTDESHSTRLFHPPSFLHHQRSSNTCTDRHGFVAVLDQNHVDVGMMVRWSITSVCAV